MKTSASDVFAFLERTHDWVIERHEIRCSPFARLRRCIRGLVVRLNEDSYVEPEMPAKLRRTLSEWLTVPVPFNALDAAGLDALGLPEYVHIRWGTEIGQLYDEARDTLAELSHIENPLRTRVSDAVRELIAKGLDFRIYCHRAAAIHFTTLATGDQDLSGLFLHTARDYRVSDPFNVLVKVGPLRIRGWGAAPSALLNAPRYDTLVQVLWSGGVDDADFGLDLIVPAVAGAGSGVHEGEAPTPASVNPERIRSGPTAWTRRTVCHGTSDAGDLVSNDEADELRLFEPMGRPAEGRAALLAHFEGTLAVPYPPHSEVLLLHPDESRERLVRRRILSDVQPGENIFLVWPHLGELDLGATRAAEGSYSAVWKRRLHEQMIADPEGLMRRLRADGVNLIGLRSCIEHWCRPSSTVIHAPQQRRHFEALIQVLGLAGELTQSSRPWSLLAWREVAISRGEAIQGGMQEQEIIDEELENALLTKRNEIQEHAQAGNVFTIHLPRGGSLEGTVSFFRVRSIEAGFRVPEAYMKTIVEVTRAQEWRV